MARFRKANILSSTIALSASLLSAVPALAQSNASSSNSNGGVTSSGTMKLGDKAPDGSLMKTHHDWRASSLVGATVYNDQGNSIGTVSDLLVSPDGTAESAIISVGGFLGIGSKLVEVPYKNMKFAPSQSNPASGSKEATQANAPATTTATATSATAPANSAGTAGTTGVAAPANGTGTAPASQEYSLVLPNATKASLTSDPAFSY